MKHRFIFASLFLANLNYILYNTLEISPLIKDGIRVITIVLLFINILINIKVIRFYPVDILLVTLIATSLVSFNINPNIFNFIYIILIVLLSKDIPMESFLKNNYFNTFIGVCLIIILLQVGLTQNIEYQGLERTRNTFGFKNVNAFSSYMYSSTLIFILSRKRTKWFHIILASIVIVTIYRFSDTRTILVCFIIFLCVYLFLISTGSLLTKKKISQLLKPLVVFIAVLPVFASFLSPLILKQYPYLDRITSYRLSINTIYISENKIINLLFGGSVQPDIDNGFLTLFYSAGLLFSIFVVYMILKAICLQMDLKGYKSVAFIISFMYFNSLEALIIRPELSITIYFWVLVYWSFAKPKREKSYTISS